MARAYVDSGTDPVTSHSGTLTPYEQRHVIRRLPPESDRRYRELAEKQDRGILAPAERAEMRALAAEAEQLTLENARALLRHRSPDAFAAALADEQRAQQRTRARRKHARLPRGT